jgi:hypothetical protein
MATWAHFSRKIALDHLHISHFFVTSENSPKKTTTGGGPGDGAGPECFFISTKLTHKNIGKFLEYGFSIVNSTIVS